MAWEKSIRYVRLDPTGNVTCLVLSPVGMPDRSGVTARLMRLCEQVGYLLPAGSSGAKARLEMMGGEFCGNASMAAAAYLARESGMADGAETVIPLEVSGAEGIVPCRIRREGELWRGTVSVPLPVGMAETEVDGRRCTAVFLPGMTHLILSGGIPDQEEAEALLRTAALRFSAPALGLLEWDGEREYMKPLVYVRGSETMVWETACGSGTAAIAYWRAMQAGHTLRTAVRQPGGTLTAEAEIRDGVLLEIRLTGMVRMEETAELEENA